MRKNQLVVASIITFIMSLQLLGQKKAPIKKTVTIKKQAPAATSKKQPTSSTLKFKLPKTPGDLDIPYHTIVDLETRVKGAFAKAEGLIDYFRKNIFLAGERAEFLKAFLEQIPSYVQSIPYSQMSFKLHHPDPEEPGSAVEVIFTFSDYIDRFDGVRIDVNIELLPSYFKNPLNTAIEQDLQELFAGQLCEASTGEIGRMSLYTSPVAECYLRAGILAKDLNTQQITADEYSSRLLNLFFRLMHDTSIKTLEDAKKQVPSLFQNFTQNIGMGGKTFDAYLSDAFSTFLKIQNYDTSKSGQEKERTEQSIIDGCASIILKLAREYSQEKEKFLEAPEGKNAQRDLVKTNDFATFNQRFAKSKALITAASQSVLQLLKGFGPYHQAKPLLLQELAPFENGILRPVLGVGLADLLSLADSRIAKSGQTFEADKVAIRRWLVPSQEGSWFYAFPEPQLLVAIE